MDNPAYRGSGRKGGGRSDLRSFYNLTATHFWTSMLFLAASLPKHPFSVTLLPYWPRCGGSALDGCYANNDNALVSLRPRKRDIWQALSACTDCVSSTHFCILDAKNARCIRYFTILVDINNSTMAKQLFNERIFFAWKWRLGWRWS